MSRIAMSQSRAAASDEGVCPVEYITALYVIILISQRCTLVCVTVQLC